jgi:hypothetical protein
MNAISREIFAQRNELADRIRSIRPRVLFDVNRDAVAGAAFDPANHAIGNDRVSTANQQ